MFTVYVGSILTTALVRPVALRSAGEEPPWFILAISAWLWFTVLFANFAEAMAEGRGKAQADALRRARHDVSAKKFVVPPAEPLRRAARSSDHAPTRRRDRGPGHRPAQGRRGVSSRPATIFPPTAR